MIAGLEEPDYGDVYLEGSNVTHQYVKDRKVGFVFQHYALFKHMTVRDNIAFGLKVNKWQERAIKDRVNLLTDMIQLNGYENRYPSQLSGGQRQRVALARALAPNPHILLLDEPFGALDAKVRRNLSIQLRKLHNEIKTTCVFVTHDQEEAFELADKIVVINHGHVEQVGTAETVYERPCSKFVASFIGNVNVVEGYANDHTIRIGTDTVPGLTTSIKEGEIVILIRPENIERMEHSDYDCVKAVIRNVAYRGDHYEILLDMNGINLKMDVTKQFGLVQQWVRDSIISIRFSNYAVFPADCGHHILRQKLQNLGYIE